MMRVPTIQAVFACVPFLAVTGGSYDFGFHAQAEHAHGSLHYLKIMVN